MTTATRAVADPAALPPRRAPRSRSPELEGQRGLAALLVVVFHAYQHDRSGPQARYPYEGAPAHVVLHRLDAVVDWFFVLSAFLLALPYARAVLAGQTGTSARTFLGRRAVRVVPLYLVAVLLVWALRNPGLPGDWRGLLEHLTFTQVFDRSRIFSTIGPAWSLAVEVQFYVLLAALGTLATRVGRRTASARVRHALLGGLVALPALGCLLWVLVHGPLLDRPYEDWPVWFGLPAKLGVFACGLAAAGLVAVRDTRSDAPLGRPATWALRGTGLAVLACAFLTRGTSGPADAGFHTLCGVGFALLVLAGALGRPAGPWHRLSATGALPWVGLVSYSLYLWHEPVLLLLADRGLVPAPSAAAFPVTALVLVVCSLVVAWVSYWVVERPCSSLRGLLGPVPDRSLRRPSAVAP